MTIRKKLILLYAGLIGIVLIFFGLGVFSVIRTTWIETVDATLTDAANQVIKNSDSYQFGEFGTPTHTIMVLPQLDIFRTSNIYVQAWAPKADGSNDVELWAKSDNLRDYNQPLDRSSLDASTPTYSTIKISNAEIRVLTLPLRLQGQTTNFGVIQVADSLDMINQATNRLSLFRLGGGILEVLASSGLCSWRSDPTSKTL
jgi:hypothetical protein